MLTSSLFLGYAYVMEAFSAYLRRRYGRARRCSSRRVFGYYAAIFWATILFNVAAAAAAVVAAAAAQPDAVVLLIAIGIIIGMWCERFTIVVVSLHRTHLPSSWGVFHGTVWDWLDHGGHGRAVLHSASC